MLKNRSCKTSSGSVLVSPAEQVAKGLGHPIALLLTDNPLECKERYSCLHRCHDGKLLMHSMFKILLWAPAGG